MCCMISPKNREEILETPSTGKQQDLEICLKTAFRLFGGIFLTHLQSLFPEASPSYKLLSQTTYTPLLSA